MAREHTDFDFDAAFGGGSSPAPAGVPEGVWRAVIDEGRYPTGLAEADAGALMMICTAAAPHIRELAAGAVLIDAEPGRDQIMLAFAGRDPLPGEERPAAVLSYALADDAQRALWLALADQPAVLVVWLDGEEGRVVRRRLMPLDDVRGAIRRTVMASSAERA